MDSPASVRLRPPPLTVAEVDSGGSSPVSAAPPVLPSPSTALPVPVSERPRGWSILLEDEEATGDEPTPLPSLSRTHSAPPPPEGEDEDRVAPLEGSSDRSAPSLGASSVSRRPSVRWAEDLERNGFERSFVQLRVRQTPKSREQLRRETLGLKRMSLLHRQRTQDMMLAPAKREWLPDIMEAVFILVALYYLFVPLFRVGFLWDPAGRRPLPLTSFIAGWCCDLFCALRLLLVCRWRCSARVATVMGTLELGEDSSRGDSGSSSRGQKGSSRGGSARSWSRRELALCATCLLPWDVFAVIAGGPGSASSSATLALLRLAKLPLVALLPPAFRRLRPQLPRWLRELLSSTAVLFLRRVAVMAVTSHLCACGFLFVTRAECGWALDDCAGGSWAALEFFPSQSLLRQYVRSYYWASVTLVTVGFGDIVPLTVPQMLFTAATMLLGAYLIARTVAFFSFIFGFKSEAAMRFETLADDVQQYCRARQLPAGLRERIEGYFEYLWTAHRGIDEAAVMAGLPAQLRSESLEFLQGDGLSKIPFLAPFGHGLVASICTLLQVRIYSAGAYIIRAEQKGELMFLLNRGVVAAVLLDRDVLKLPAGSYFGEDVMFDDAAVYQTDVRSCSFCETYVLSRKQLSNVLQTLYGSEAAAVRRQMAATAKSCGLRQKVSNHLRSTSGSQLRIFSSRHLSVLGRWLSIDFLTQWNVPHSDFRRMWDLLALLALLYNLIEVPFRAAFQVSDWQAFYTAGGAAWLRGQFVVDILADSFFWLDIWLHARHFGFMGMRDGVRQPIMDRSAIWRRYRARLLQLDLAANLPLDYILAFTVGALPATLARFLRLLRLVHVSKYSRSLTYLLLERVRVRAAWRRLAYMFAQLAILLHWVGCGWHAIAAAESAAGASVLSAGRPQPEYADCLRESTLGGGCTWLDWDGLPLAGAGADVFARYVRSVYWAIVAMTTVGYGDIRPFSTLESAYAAAWVLLGGIFYYALVGAISQALSSLSATRAAFRDKMRSMMQYLRHRKVRLDLVDRVLRYYEYRWASQKGVDEAQILAALPVPLLEEVSSHLNRDAMRSIALFADCETSFLKALSTRLRHQVYLPGDDVLVPGQFADRLFILNDGLLSESFPNIEQEIRRFSKGDCFAAVAFLTAAVMDSRVRALRFCDCSTLARPDYDAVVARYPGYSAEIAEKATEEAEREAQLRHAIKFNLCLPKPHSMLVEAPQPRLVSPRSRSSSMWSAGSPQLRARTVSATSDPGLLVSPPKTLPDRLRDPGLLRRAMSPITMPRSLTRELPTMPALPPSLRQPQLVASRSMPGRVIALRAAAAGGRPSLPSAAVASAAHSGVSTVSGPSIAAFTLPPASSSAGAVLGTPPSTPPSRVSEVEERKSPLLPVATPAALRRGSGGGGGGGGGDGGGGSGSGSGSSSSSTASADIGSSVVTGGDGDGDGDEAVPSPMALRIAIPGREDDAGLLDADTETGSRRSSSALELMAADELDDSPAPRATLSSRSLMRTLQEAKLAQQQQRMVVAAVWQAHAAQRWFIHPNSTFSVVWEVIVLVVVVFQLLVTPCYIAFLEQPHWALPSVRILFAIDYALDAVLLTDILLSWRRKAFMANGVLVTSKERIMENYARSGHMMLHVAASLPLYWWGNVTVMSLCRLPRLLRTSQLPGLARRLEDFVAARTVGAQVNMLRLLVLLAVLVLQAHLLGCGMYLLARLEGAPSSWAKADGLFDPAVPLLTRYVRALYWGLSLLTVVCFGDVTPKTVAGSLYTIFGCVQGMFFIAHLIGEMTAVMSQLDQQAAAFQRKLDRFQLFSQRKRLPTALKNRVLQYYDYRYANTRGLDERVILGDLPESLHQQVAVELFGDELSDVELFQVIPLHLLHALTLVLRRQLYLPNDFIIRERDIGRELFIVKKGKVEVVSEKTNVHIITLHAGSLLGESAFFFPTVRRSTSCVAATYCEAFILSRADWDSVMRGNHAVEEELCVLVRRNMEKYRTRKKLKETPVARAMHSAAGGGSDGSVGTVGTVGTVGSSRRVSRSASSRSRGSSHSVHGSATGRAAASAGSGRSSSGSSRGIVHRSDSGRRQRSRVAPMSPIAALRARMQPPVSPHGPGLKRVSVVPRKAAARSGRKVSLATIEWDRMHERLGDRQPRNSWLASKAMHASVSSLSGIPEEMLEGMRKKPDSDGRSVWVRHSLPAKWTLPNSVLRRCWEGVIMLIVLYNALVTPAMISFPVPGDDYCRPSSALAVLEHIMDALLLLDILLQWRFFSYVHLGKVVTDSRRIQARYASSWLKVDVAAALPLDLIALALPARAAAMLVPAAGPGMAPALAALSLGGWYSCRLRHLLRLNRLLRLLHFNESVQEMERFFLNVKDMRVRPATLRVWKTLTLFLFTCHWSGCAWYLLGATWTGATPWSQGASWLGADIAGGVFPPEAPWVRSVYKAITALTTVGYGDIVCVNEEETVLDLVIIIVSAVLFSSVVGALEEKERDEQTSSSIIGEKRRRLKRYLQRRGISEDLATRIVHYYEHVWDRQDSRLEEIVEELPTTLQKEIALFINREIIERAPLFNDCELAFVKAIAFALKPQLFMRKDYIVREGEIGNEMYFVSSGALEVFPNNNSFVAYKRKGDFFGEVALLFNTPRSANVRALTQTELLVLTRAAYNTVMAHYPDYAERNRRDWVKASGAAAVIDGEGRRKDREVRAIEEEDEEDVAAEDDSGEEEEVKEKDMRVHGGEEGEVEEDEEGAEEGDDAASRSGETPTSEETLSRIGSSGLVAATLSDDDGDDDDGSRRDDGGVEETKEDGDEPGEGKHELEEEEEKKEEVEDEKEEAIGEVRAVLRRVSTSEAVDGIVASIGRASASPTGSRDRHVPMLSPAKEADEDAASSSTPTLEAFSADLLELMASPEAAADR
eukprot:PLAT139.1.p1 GENE.PLAT139.1~~PLAT139.1.p1  ORF type:complete len:2901 (+),score=1538.69 PLAT139.1:33-8735(+)